MENTREKFAKRLCHALQEAGYEAKPAILEREFNLRYWGKPMTLHGVRRWLRGEVLPTDDKMLVLAQWLRVDPRTLRFGEEAAHQIEQEKTLYESAARQEREAIEIFLGLSPARRRLVREVIMTCAHAEQQDQASETVRKKRTERAVDQTRSNPTQA
ncbi:transcriptional regulator [Stutzerimonas sp. NM35]|uniref:XRE family transcriptional regulator n=1 Tax=Stutzerimonas stutzeri TaxID=316 RepID=UPI0015E32399|nr:XRE family transcriptional regulator [Stutzerimonas stutzeri]MBA1263280.1 XRE family transcriptional regulator [Stutzerimonas stutzeri]